MQKWKHNNRLGFKKICQLNIPEYTNKLERRSESSKRNVIPHNVSFTYYVLFPKPINGERF